MRNWEEASRNRTSYSMGYCETFAELGQPLTIAEEDEYEPLAEEYINMNEYMRGQIAALTKYMKEHLTNYNYVI